MVTCNNNRVHYYRFAKSNDGKKTTIKCVANYGFYLPFEGQKIYITNRPSNFAGKPSTYSLTSKGKNISSIYTDGINYNIGYGDCKGDALLFVCERLNKKDGYLDDKFSMEIIVIENMANAKKELFEKLKFGECNKLLRHFRKGVKNKKNVL